MRFIPAVQSGCLRQRLPFDPGLVVTAFAEFLLVNGNAREVEDDLGCLVPEILRTERIGWVRPQGRTDDRAACRKRSARPPYMERGDMPVANGLLAPGMSRDALDGEIDFDEAFWILLGHLTFIVL